MKSNNQYSKYLSLCEKETEKTRRSLEKQIKPIIKERALALGIDIISTQHSCYPAEQQDDYYGSNAEKFVNFVHTLSDEYKLEFLFEVEKGRFRWF